MIRDDGYFFIGSDFYVCEWSDRFRLKLLLLRGEHRRIERDNQTSACGCTRFQKGAAVQRRRGAHRVTSVVGTSSDRSCAAVALPPASSAARCIARRIRG